MLSRHQANEGHAPGEGKEGGSGGWRQLSMLHGALQMCSVRASRGGERACLRLAKFAAERRRPGWLTPHEWPLWQSQAAGVLHG